MSFQKIAVLKSFTMSGIAVLALWLKMNAEKTRVLWLDRNAEQCAFMCCCGVRGCQAAPNLFTEIRTVLANTEAPMWRRKSQ